MPLVNFKSLKIAFQIKRPVVLIGEEGCSKTLMTQSFLGTLDSTEYVRYLEKNLFTYITLVKINFLLSSTKVTACLCKPKQVTLEQ
jgi:ABC-type dipeptide/oligopeptide/nickel transport system ATPase component